jgi:hypothetical protein
MTVTVDRSVNRSILIALGVVCLAFAALALVAGAQGTAPRPVRMAAAPVSAPEKAPAPTAGVPAAADSGKQLITRETYNYGGVGRRDPFVSLMNTEELRPLYNDLKLVAVAYDPSGRNSVAVLRDVTSKLQYRVKVGQEIGRMRVASIGPKSVVFGIEEFGYSRQETLAMSDSTTVRTQ